MKVSLERPKRDHCEQGPADVVQLYAARYASSQRGHTMMMIFFIGILFETGRGQIVA